jgi:hypothetical protein
MIHRYDYPVPEFTRLRWASPQAQATWEPRIREIGNAWLAAER